MKHTRLMTLPVMLGMGSWVAPLWAQGCALCREVLASGGQGGLLRGFFWSVMLLTAVPLLLVIGIAGFLFHSSRTQLKRQPPSP